MDDLTFAVEETASGGRLTATNPAGTAELTFSKAGDTRIIADHTGVPAAMGGRGVGTRLVERLHDYARERGLKVVATCPFVRAKMVEHPEWRDVLDR